jgi:hypothetical protein
VNLCFLILAVPVCVCVGLYARNKGRRFWQWAILSAIVTPLVTWLILLFMKDLRTPEQRAIPVSVSNWLLLIAGVLCAGGALYLASPTGIGASWDFSMNFKVKTPDDGVSDDKDSDDKDSKRSGH